MVELSALRAWHANPTWGDPSDLVCPVYDTLSESELARYVHRTHNAAHFVPRPAGVGLAEFVGRAVQALDSARRSGAYVQDPEDAYYVYGIRYVPPPDIVETIPARERRAQYLLLGLVGALDLTRSEPRDVALHERTFSDRVDERVALTEATGLNFAPIMAGYHTTDHRLNDRLEELLGLDRRGLSFEGPVPPVAEARLDGAVHRLWRIDEPAVVREISREVRALKLLVLDGHHRFTAARRRREAGYPSAPLTMLVDGRDRALRVLPWHRILPRATLPFGEFRARATSAFPGARAMAGGADPSRVLAALESMRARHQRGFLAAHRSELYEFPAAPGGDVGTDFDRLHELLEVELRIDPHDLLFRRSPRAVLEEIAGEEGPGGGGTGLFLPPIHEPGIEARSFGGGPMMAHKSTMFLPKVAEGLIFAPADRAD